MKLTITQFAEKTGCTRQTVYNMFDAGLKYTEKNGRRYIDSERASKWLKSRPRIQGLRYGGDK